jgi:hypothetical protein
MTWTHSWSAVCAACGRRVLHRGTAWSPRHHGRICQPCGTSRAPTDCDWAHESLTDQALTAARSARFEHGESG